MKRIIPIFIILSLFLTSCGNVELVSDNIVVYSSFYAMDSFVKTIGGTEVTRHSVVPLGSEPHDFEPTAADIAKISKADLFIYHGAGMDDWAKDIAETLPESVTVVCASEGIEQTAGDPHLWLSLEKAQKEMETIYKWLRTVDSRAGKDNWQYYLDNLNAYCIGLDALEKEYDAAGLYGKKLFVTHGAYGYLCEDYGMEQVALEGIAGDSDPSPARIAAIVDEIKESGAKAIFHDPLEGDKIAKAVAKEAGIEALELYTFEGDSEHRDYLEIMTLNLEQLKKGLN